RRRTGMAGRPAAFQGETTTMLGWPAMGETTPETDPKKLAEEARDRVRFEEEALGLADQVYRVARRLVSTREEAEDLMQETWSRWSTSATSATPTRRRSSRSRSGPSCPACIVGGVS